MGLYSGDMRRLNDDIGRQAYHAAADMSVRLISLKPYVSLAWRAAAQGALNTCKFGPQ